MVVWIERVHIPAMSTVGLGYGYTDEGLYVEVVGDHRPMRDLGQALAWNPEPIAVNAPDYAVRIIAPPKS